MYFIKKQRNKVLYKKILTLKKNIQNSSKILNFKKQKWRKFKYLHFGMFFGYFIQETLLFINDQTVILS